ncbi:hypothetical protein CDAR_230351 [Caerostris darwini]|uniref:Uncharacterized protein n=1 Tax=Caerostris darwini TaxID=1538125 RepID=A0AAV4QA48_9ARAC|nr:hypothetical protein CDAR_230351 [Caerostris darwini]
MDVLSVPRVFCDLILHYPVCNFKPPNPLEVSALTPSEIFSKFIPDSELRNMEPNENDPSGQVRVSTSFVGSNSIWRHMRPSPQMIYSARGGNCGRLIAPHPSYLCQFVRPEGRERTMDPRQRIRRIKECRW